MAFTAAQIPGIAGRVYPPTLSGPLYPDGIPIYDEERLPEIVERHGVRLVAFSYSDLTHVELMNKASKVLALGCDFMLLGPRSTMLRSRKKVVAVTAVKTGAGKSTVSRLLVKLLREKGVKPVVVRHPMPYGVLEKQVVQRFSSLDDLEIHRCSIEEREEIEPHLREGNIVYTGVDYEMVLREAEKEGDVIVWDGGNNDLPFYWPDLHITVVDATRPELITNSYPGEANIYMADVVVLHKVDKVSKEQLDKAVEIVRSLNPRAEVVSTASKIRIEDDASLRGRRVVVVEDSPSVTHGGMSVGAGYIAAVNAGASIVDPRPYAVGTIAKLYREYTHLGPVVPALGYTEEQLRDLGETLRRVEAEMIVSASPADFTKLIDCGKPLVRVWYDAEQVSGTPLSTFLRRL
ncbi:MAG: GTP-binding protein [Candidatus Caldarchaeum sp.]